MKRLLGQTIGGLTRGSLNGPAWLRKITAFALDGIDDRYQINAPAGSFTLRVGNPLERWRAETLFDKEPETIRWLNDTIAPDSVFYDVGANIGIFTLYAAHLNETVRAICFEPESLNFARLNRNIVDNTLSDRVLAFPVALGATFTARAFNLSRFQAGGALHGNRHTVVQDAPHRQGIVITTLDDFLQSSSPLPSPTHLKIDVDGPEVDVLKGAAETLTTPALRHLLVEATADNRGLIEQIAADAGFIFKEQGAESVDGTNIIFERA
ncbi:MAG: FkbM family methyltransferase [Rhodospirillales bacterium]